MRARKRAPKEEWPEISPAALKKFEEEIDRDRKAANLTYLGTTPKEIAAALRRMGVKSK